MTDYSHRSALAPALLSERVGRTLQEVLLVLVGTALLAISAKVKVPFYPVPMTLQTLVVVLIAATYGYPVTTSARPRTHCAISWLIDFEPGVLPQDQSTDLTPKTWP